MLYLFIYKFIIYLFIISYSICIGGWGNEANREVVFRVRVVRDVRAKLCASYPGGVALAPDACPAAAAPSVAVLVSRGVPAGVPVVSRPAVFLLVSSLVSRVSRLVSSVVSRRCPCGVPVVSRWFWSWFRLWFQFQFWFWFRLWFRSWFRLWFQFQF